MENNYHEVIVHYLMAIVGGFFGGYAIFTRMNVFGSAQTANLIDLIRDILGSNYIESMIRIGALLIYISAMIIATILTYRTKWKLQYLVLYLELACIIVLGIIPESVNPIIALYPCFFVTAFQWCIFKGALGYTSSTIFSTNNLKQTILSITEYFLIEDPQIKQEKLKKGCFFGGTLFCFHSGVALAYILHIFFAFNAIWFLSILIFINLAYFIYHDKYQNNYIVQHIKKMI